MASETSEAADDDPHLTPDLPPAIEAPDLRGAPRTRPEEDPTGRRSPLPTPYGHPAPDRRTAARGARRTARVRH